MIIKWKKGKNKSAHEEVWWGYVSEQLMFEVALYEQVWGPGYQLLQKDDKDEAVDLWFMCDRYETLKGAKRGALQQLPPIMQLASLSKKKP